MKIRPDIISVIPLRLYLTVLSKTFLDITMSLDGYVAGPGISQELPMGLAGHRLHDWLFSKKTETDAALQDETVKSSGAVILGGHTYSTAIQGAWESKSPFTLPAFVLCSKLPDHRAEGFEFVLDGVHKALDRAGRAAAGKNIWVMGGAGLARQFIGHHLLDEIHIHIAPLLLIRGTRLFEDTGGEMVELEAIRTIETPAAIHIVYRILK